jgi:hypothetical protein
MAKVERYKNHRSSPEERATTSRVIIAIVIALGLMGAVAITVFVIQQAEARGCESGFPNSARGINASKGRCFGH